MSLKELRGVVWTETVRDRFCYAGERDGEDERE